MNGYEAAMRNAADAFVDALAGTDTTFTVYAFSSNSPIDGGPNVTTPISLRTPTGVNQVKASYANWRAGGNTNYAEPLKAILRANNPTDVVIFMTDGGPTDESDGVHVANTLRLAGTKIIAFGVGSGIYEEQLVNISGPVQNSDYYMAANFAQVSTYLYQLASGSCSASLQVEAREAPANQDRATVNASTGTPAPDWDFTAQVVGNGTQVQGTTGAAGVADLAVPVAGRDTITRVLVTQSPKADWEVLPQGSQTATCHLTANPSQSIATTNAPGVPGGFLLDLPGGEGVTCHIVNGQFLQSPLQVLSRQASPNQDKSAVTATTGSPAPGWQYTAKIDGTSTQVQATSGSNGLAALPLPVASTSGTTKVLVTQTPKTAWEILEQSGKVASCYLTDNPSQAVTTTNATNGFFVDLPGVAGVTCVMVNGQYFNSPLQVQAREAPVNQDKAAVTAATGSPAPGWQYTAKIDGTSTQVQDITGSGGMAALTLPVGSATGTTRVLVTQGTKADWELLTQGGAVATCHLTANPAQVVPTSNATNGFYVDLPGDAGVTCVVVNGQYFNSPLQVQAREAPVNQDKATVTATTGTPASGWQYTAKIDGTSTQAQDTTGSNGLADLTLPVGSATGTTRVLVTQGTKADWELLTQGGAVATCHMTANPAQVVPTTNATNGFFVDLPGDAGVTCVVVNGQYFNSALRVMVREAPVNQDKSSVGTGTGAPASGWQLSAQIAGTTTQAQDTTGSNGLADLTLPVDSAGGTTRVLVTMTPKADWELLPQGGKRAVCYLTADPSQRLITEDATGVNDAFYVDLPGDAGVTCVMVNGQYFDSPLQVQAREAPVNIDPSTVTRSTGTPAIGWQFTAQIDGTSTQVQNTTGATGLADLTLPVDPATGTTRVLVTQTGKTDWAVLQQAGFTASCFLTFDPAVTLTTTNAPSGFYVNLPGTDPVTCVVVNGQHFTSPFQVLAREAPVNTELSAVTADTGEPAAGWQYTAERVGTTYQVQATTGGDGIASLPLPVDSRTAPTQVLVTQVGQVNWAILYQAGYTASCQALETRAAALEVTNTQDGFYVTLPGTAPVTCVIVNGQHFDSSFQVMAREAPVNVDPATVGAGTGAPASGWQYTAQRVGTSYQVQGATAGTGLVSLPLPVDSRTASTRVLVTQTGKTDWAILHQAGYVATCFLTANPLQTLATTNVTNGFYVDLPGTTPVTCVIVNGQHFNSPLQVLARQAPVNTDLSTVTAATGDPAPGWQYAAQRVGTAIEVQGTSGGNGLASLPVPVDSRTASTQVLVTQANKTDWAILQQAGFVATCYLTDNPSQKLTTTNATDGFYVSLPGTDGVTCVVVNGQHFNNQLQVEAREAPVNTDLSTVTATTGSLAPGWQYTAQRVGTSYQAQDTTSATGLAYLSLPVDSRTASTQVLVTQAGKTDWAILQQAGFAASCHLTGNPSQKLVVTNAANGFYVNVPGTDGVTCVIVNGQHFTNQLQVQARQAPVNTDLATVTAQTGQPASGWDFTAQIVGTATGAQDITGNDGIAALPLPVVSRTASTTVLVTQAGKIDWAILQQAGYVATCYLTDNPSQKLATTNANNGFYVNLPGTDAVTCVVVNGQHFNNPLQVEAREAPVNTDLSTVDATTGAPAPGWEYTAERVGTTYQVHDTTGATGLANLSLPVDSRTASTRVLVTQTGKTDWAILQQAGYVATCYRTDNPSQTVATTNATNGFYVYLPGTDGVTCVVVNGQHFTSPLQVLSREAPVNQDRSAVDATTGTEAAGWEHTVQIVETGLQAQDITKETGLADLSVPVTSRTGTTTVLITQTGQFDWAVLQQAGYVATCYLTEDPTQTLPTTNAADGVDGFYVDLPGIDAVTCVIVNGQHFNSPLRLEAREAPVNQDPSKVDATTGTPAKGWQYTAQIVETTAQAQDVTDESGLAYLTLPVDSREAITRVLVTQTEQADWELLRQSGLVATCFMTEEPTQSVETTNAPGTNTGFYIELPGIEPVTCVVVNGQYVPEPMEVTPPVVKPPVPKPALAFTGANLVGQLGLGAGVIVTGWWLVVLARRRRQPN